MSQDISDKNSSLISALWLSAICCGRLLRRHAGVAHWGHTAERARHTWPQVWRVCGHAAEERLRCLQSLKRPASHLGNNYDRVSVRRSGTRYLDLQNKTGIVSYSHWRSWLVGKKSCNRENMQWHHVLRKIMIPQVCKTFKHTHAAQKLTRRTRRRAHQNAECGGGTCLCLYRIFIFCNEHLVRPPN